MFQDLCTIEDDMDLIKNVTITGDNAPSKFNYPYYKLKSNL